METKAVISFDEYLHTSFDGVDCEYCGGKIIERSIPDYLHGATQALLAGFFGPLRKNLSLSVCISIRMKLREELVRVADFAVFWPSRPAPVPDFPPLIAAEVLSQDDRAMAVLDKLQEYRDWGIAHVWLIDPHSQRFYTCETGLKETKVFRVPELGIELGPDQILE